MGVWYFVVLTVIFAKWNTVACILCTTVGNVVVYYTMVSAILIYTIEQSYTGEYDDGDNMARTLDTA